MAIKAIKETRRIKRPKSKLNTGVRNITKARGEWEWTSKDQTSGIKKATWRNTSKKLR